MTIRTRWALTGILSGALGLTAVAQDPATPGKEKEAEPAAPAAPKENPAFKAPADVAAVPADAQKTESGLAFKILKAGEGKEKPSKWDKVKVDYTGWQSSDGKMFDSSLKARHPGQAPEPAEFALFQVIPGWTEGLQLMVAGEKRRFWIPGEMAYGNEPSPQGRPFGMLVFDVELHSFTKSNVPDAPKELTAPADAEKTESGLASKILEAGTGKEKPGASDVATVNFSGWKKDGDLLHSTIIDGQPSQIKIDQVPIKGWTEALQLMVKGEKRRFWIPAALAFGNEGPEGTPTGDLIFDMELVDFKSTPKPPPAPKAPDAPADVAAAPDDASKTDSGLASKVLKAGEGTATPGEDDFVKFDFSGWKTDGSSVGSSKMPNGRPMAMPLSKAPIKGWTEGIQLMKKGETRRFWIPAALGFGNAGQPGAPTGDLVFDIELLEFSAPISAPDDVAAAPADAEKTESGLASKVLKKGTGEKKATATDSVTVHYTGWRAEDGKMFDSSVQRGEPFTFSLRGGVIQGWLEGAKLMVEGEKRRFWIPGNLAYDGQDGRPQGVLVFDIEVLKIGQ